MSRTYTRLPLALGAWQSNFIAIPTEFAKAIRASPDFANQGVVAFRLNWTGLKTGSTTETETKECYVGWNGALSRGTFLQVPDKLGELSGLSTALTESKARGGSGLVVNAYAVKSCEIAKRVDVEPETFEDWEVLERNAGFVETQMLSQICVVYPNQHFVVWVANIPVKLLVVNGVSSFCVKMANETEVVVAPKPRPDAARRIGGDASEKPAQTDSKGAAVVLRVQPIEGTMCNGMALVNGATLRLLREVAEWDACGEDSVDVDGEGQAVSCLNPAYPVLCRVISNDGEESSVLSLAVSERVANGHVALSKSSRKCSCKPFSRVKLIPVLYTAEMKTSNVPASIILRRLTNSNWSSSNVPNLNDTEDQLVKSALKRSLTMNSSVLSNGSWITIDSIPYKVVIQPHGTNNTVSNKPFLFKDESILNRVSWSIGEDLPITLHSKSSFSSQSNNGDDKLQSTTPADDGEDDEVSDSLDQLWDCNAEDSSSWTLATLGGPAKKAGGELKEHISPLLSTKSSLARAKLGTPSVGGAYLYGSRGSGKSTLIKALGRSLGLDKDFLTCVIRVECATLKGGKRSAIQKRLEKAVQLAQARSPALLVLEDLDALLPQPSNPGEEDAQTVWLSEFLEGLVYECRVRQERFEQAALGAVSKGQLSSFADVAQWNKLAVGFMATGRGRKSMRTALNRLGMFEKRIEMPALDLQGRRDVLLALCRGKKSSLGTFPTDNEMDVVAARTEGYSAADLETLVERAVHAKVVDDMETIFSSEKENTEDETSNDPAFTTSGYLEKALEGFTPSSLRGVKLAKSETNWSDVGGLEIVRNVLKETLELPFQFAELYDRSPQRLASGILLYGPPGCGKTLLAGAVASECGLNFISVKGPEVLNKYIGASEQAIRDLFARAASVTPCIVFFDEFDAVAPRRGSDSTGVTDRVVNQLLTFLDGVESRKGVYVMAATSRPDLVDPALLRPGRLDKQLYCGFPDEQERFSILSAVSNKLTMEDDARQSTLRHIARKGVELTGADLQALCATAQLLAVHEESPIITSDHLLRAFSDTRPSVSREDRAKFDRIYRQFRGDRQAPTVTDNGVMFFSEDAKQKVALM